jgi:hypothetical protein
MFSVLGPNNPPEKWPSHPGQLLQFKNSILDE